MTNSKTKKETSNKLFTRADSVNGWTFATCLRLFGICVQLMACDPTVTVPEYHPREAQVEDYVMVSPQG